ncbi:retinoid-inducible serine carboxypeptidase-like [Episyrphus balteatus]|uniref:retinoid-inducible serine carboxypeptidase-like n=1 Tax=Episyrphus balteatus TaxID=286459 RepID=UPI0024867538|nr:retinoid-inducible serine carboxypeptidase-like [Episyrphus balteatus]
MVRLLVVAFAVTACFLLLETSAKEGFGPGNQDYGYVDVRKGAHMFYWLFYTTANVSKYTDRPLAIWLQGGPGASSTGYGNFEELGPLTLDLVARNHTWVKDMNVLFIDNPVGSGFSYVDSSKYLTRNNKQIALDLVELMKGFYNNHPEFKKVPLHIFCESYGGKMAPEFALELYHAIEKKEIESNLKSVALGDPWVSPMDSVNAWAPLLLNMGIIDHDGHDKIMKSADKTGKALDNGKYSQSTLYWSDTQRVLLDESKGVDFYNILLPTNGDAYSRSLLSNEELMYRTLVKYDIDENRDQILQNLMRGAVSKALKIPKNVVWGSQSSTTFNVLMGDFMKPVVDIVETLLNSTSLEVSVFSGQLDLICATPGAVNWINGMKWNNKSAYESAPRVGIVVDRVLEGYQKEAGKFAMFWVDRAGHMVPNDNPRAMDYILKKYTKYDN